MPFPAELEEFDSTAAHGQRSGRDGGLKDFARRAESKVKRELARELHDSVAQILTLMVVDMENFKLDQAGQHQVVEKVDSLQESTRAVLHNLRQVLYDLREEPSTESGFVLQVRALLLRFEGATGIRSMLKVSSEWPSPLSAAMAHNLYRIVEEALNNVRMHSGAGRVDVLLAANGDGVQLTVQDDGRGLSPGEGGRRLGMGMMGMRERAVLLGGELDVTSTGSGGTTVKAVVPTAAKEITS
ncbi:MAG: sensor histidine kinase [Chloroflexi bacterium]|nr:MAG: sensor histidine kinase [Chloroflexota bacterium]